MGYHEVHIGVKKETQDDDGYNATLEYLAHVRRGRGRGRGGGGDSGGAGVGSLWTKKQSRLIILTLHQAIAASILSIPSSARYVNNCSANCAFSLLLNIAFIKLAL